MKVAEREGSVSPRPYGTRVCAWGAFPGFRFASSGAILDASLRDVREHVTGWPVGKDLL